MPQRALSGPGTAASAETAGATRAMVPGQPDPYIGEVDPLNNEVIQFTSAAPNAEGGVKRSPAGTSSLTSDTQAQHAPEPEANQ